LIFVNKNSALWLVWVIPESGAEAFFLAEKKSPAFGWAFAINRGVF
jgi:hypothetical protein